MKKKALAVLLTALMILSLASCGNSGSIPGDNPPEFEDIPNQEIDPEWEAEQEQKYEQEQYGLDLSMYDDHGEWSYDRMWVRKTEESWDAVKGYYGYIDREGNLIGEWHEERTNDNSFRNEEFLSYELETAPWRVPGDFQGEYAVVLCNGSGSTVSSACVEVVDMQGNSVGRFAPDFRTYSYKTDELMLKDFAGKLNEDVLFFDYDDFLEDDNIHMMWIENGTLCESVVKTNAWSAYWIQDLTNGYYPFLYYYKAHYNPSDDDCRFGLIDQNGVEVFYKEWQYEVKEITPLENRTVAIEFIGIDENKYTAVMDFDGNWVEEPTLAS